MTILLLQSGPGAAGAATAPVNTVLPVISGSALVGSTLTTTTGTWTGSPTGYTYQWQRGGVNIIGATASTYLLVTADLSATITATVTASNVNGSSSATSAGVGPIASAEAAAFLARTSGLDTTHTNAYSALINGLVADGVWSNLDLLHVYATQDSTTALLNLVSTSYNGTANGSPAFTADRGFTGVSGSSTVYINTGFNPATASSPHFVLNSAHIAAWNLTNATVTTNGCFGASTGTNSPQSYVIPKFSDGNCYIRLNVSTPSADNIANPDATGHHIGNRSAVSSVQVYKNGSSFGSNGNSSTAVPNNNFYSLANNTNGTAQGVALQLAAISCGGSLSATNAANFFNRMLTYMTAVGVVPPFSSPLNLVGLVGWWDASVTASLSLSGSTITAVADQSTSGKNLGQNGSIARPTYNATGFNSRPAMMFAAASAQMLSVDSFPIGTGSTLTVFAVATMTSSTANYGRLLSYIGLGQAHDYDNAGSGTLTRQASNAAMNWSRSSGGVAPAAMSYSTPHRIIMTITSAGLTSIYIDGVLGVTGTFSGNFINNGSIGIGGGKVDVGYWDGAIGEIGVATGYSDSITVAQLDNYLKAKWGL